MYELSAVAGLKVIIHEEMLLAETFFPRKRHQAIAMLPQLRTAAQFPHYFEVTLMCLPTPVSSSM